MKLLTPLLFGIALLCNVTLATAQSSKAYAPFKYDAEDLTLTLDITQSAWVKKFAPVLERHHRNPSDASEWSGLFDIILGMKNTDLSISGDITFDSEDNTVKAVATKKEAIDGAMAAIRSVIATPQKLEAFLIDFDTTLEKAKERKKKK